MSKYKKRFYKEEDILENEIPFTGKRISQMCRDKEYKVKNFKKLINWKKK